MWRRFFPRPISTDEHVSLAGSIRTVSLIGNGDIAPELAGAIDSSDWVVRFNAARHCGSAGHRTDTLAIANHGVPGKTFARKPALINERARTHAKELLLAVDSSDPPPPYCDGYSDGAGDYARTIMRKIGKGRPCLIVPSSIHRTLTKILRLHDSKPDVLPSTGALAIKLFSDLHPDAELRLFGFSFEGWHGHCWEAERSWAASMPNVVRF